MRRKENEYPLADSNLGVRPQRVVRRGSFLRKGWRKFLNNAPASFGRRFSYFGLPALAVVLIFAVVFAQVLQIGASYSSGDAQSFARNEDVIPSSLLEETEPLTIETLAVEDVVLSRSRTLPAVAEPKTAPEPAPTPAPSLEISVVEAAVPAAPTKAPATAPTAAPTTAPTPAPTVAETEPEPEVVEEEPVVEDESSEEEVADAPVEPELPEMGEGTGYFLPVGREAYVRVDNGYIRAEANTDSEIVGHVGAGDVLWQMTTDGEWSYIEMIDGTKGFMRNDLFQYDPVNIISVAWQDEWEALQEAATDYSYSEDSGDEVVWLPGEVVINQDAYIAVSVANLRSDTSLDSEVIGQVEFGTAITQYSYIGDWSWVITPQGNGYMLSSLLQAYPVYSEYEYEPDYGYEEEYYDDQYYEEEYYEEEYYDDQYYEEEYYEEEYHEDQYYEEEYYDDQYYEEEEYYEEEYYEDDYVEDYEPDVPAATSDGQRAVDMAMQYLGGSYIYGACHPSHGGFDCSGLVYYVYTQLGYSIGRGATDQTYYGISVPLSDVQPGDLLFWSHDYGDPGVSHVGIYIGGGQFIHASSSRTGIILSDLWSDYYSDCCLVKRIAY